MGASERYRGVGARDLFLVPLLVTLRLCPQHWPAPNNGYPWPRIIRAANLISKAGAFHNFHCTRLGVCLAFAALVLTPAHTHDWRAR